jgi:hypothetical protein
MRFETSRSGAKRGTSPGIALKCKRRTKSDDSRRAGPI